MMIIKLVKIYKFTFKMEYFLCMRFELLVIAVFVHLWETATQYMAVQIVLHKHCKTSLSLLLKLKEFISYKKDARINVLSLEI